MQSRLRLQIIDNHLSTNTTNFSASRQIEKEYLQNAYTNQCSSMFKIITVPVPTLEKKQNKKKKKETK